ncbi:hypothetical protein [Bradyrhizobium sp.]
MKKYDATPRGYLARARDCLLKPEPAYLFYAALELRFCIEERQDTYVQAQRRYIKSVPPANKIGHQAAALRRVFRGNDIFQVKFDFYDIPPAVLRFTPVTSELQKAAEKLGNLLHARDEAPAMTDPWWAETREELLRAYRLAWIACQGELLSPMMINKKGEVVGMMEITGLENKDFMDRFAEVGRSFKAIVSHVQALPDRLPDL